MDTEQTGWRIGIDLGGTKTALGLISPDDRILTRQRFATQAEEGARQLVARIATAVSQLCEMLPNGQNLTAIGICCPGPVDHISGKLIDPPNLPTLHHTSLREMLETKLKVPVILEHDAKAAAIGEFHYGAGKGEASMVYIVVGTGVGAAIILNGSLLRGERNSAGEIGHITLDRQGDPCSCGSRGCVETFLSGPWISRRYHRACQSQIKTDIDFMPTNPSLPRLSGEQIAQLASGGDEIAIKTFTEAGEALGIAVATVAMILNIDLFVIGSSVAKVGGYLLEPARQTVTKHCYASVGCGVRIQPTILSDDGPILGCGWLAREKVANNGS